MTDVLSCYRCGHSLEQLTMPLRRLDECPACRAELHVCRMCLHYAPSVPKGCDEDDAPEVRAKDRANFCDWFQPDPRAHKGDEWAAQQQAQARLRALFDEDTPADTDDGPQTDAQRQAEALFRK